MTAHFHGTVADRYADRIAAFKGSSVSTLDLRHTLNYYQRMFSKLRYEMDTTRSLLPADLEGNDSQALTEKEAALRLALLNAPQRNITTESISNCLATPSAHSLRQTIRELREQAKGAPDGLKSALGQDLFEMIEAWGDDGADTQGFE